jgi:hypothetical protein
LRAPPSSLSKSHTPAPSLSAPTSGDLAMLNRQPVGPLLQENKPRMHVSRCLGALILSWHRPTCVKKGGRSIRRSTERSWSFAFGRELSPKLPTPFFPTRRWRVEVASQNQTIYFTYLLYDPTSRQGKGKANATIGKRSTGCRVYSAEDMTWILSSSERP